MAKKRKGGDLLAIYREKDSKTWRVVYRFTTWKGEEKQTSKRGFETKRDAQAWEREQMQKVSASLDMTFESFVGVYSEDRRNRMKENTWLTKENIVRTKLLPCFGKRKISEIKPKDVMAWQNEMVSFRD